MSVWSQLKEGLRKSSSQLKKGLKGVFSGEALSAEKKVRLEEVLLGADMGVEVTKKILAQLTKEEDLPSILTGLLHPYERSFEPALTQRSILLVTGVNGSGKTTTLGKWAALWSAQGHRVHMVAADTFRAGAGEQLAIWAERSKVALTLGEPGADPASVVFKGLKAFREEGGTILLIDTAGRLPHNAGLMDEIKKIHRVIEKNKLPEEAYERILVLDATNGQHALTQARVFNEALSLTGLVMAKLDGTASGGLLFSITDALHLPILFIGLGESIDALQPFSAAPFVESLLQEDRA